jgi:hypothetical protein
MKKSLLLIVALTLIVINASCQDVKIGVRFKPLNSSYITHELMNYTPNQSSTYDSKNRFDSLTVGIFFEKYFAKKAFLIRVDVNYADMQISYSDKSSNINQWYNQSSDNAEVRKQKYFNINLGIGTHVNWSKFTFTFGAHIPFTFLPKGKQTLDENDYQDNIKTQNTKGTGTYKPTMGIGIGAFGGVSVTLLKHLSIGMDVSYQIEYLSRNITWHDETYHYQPTVYMTYSDEKQKFRNYFTSKIVPSIVIAYAFDCKKKEAK